jgi:hypothetical protein
MRTAAIQQESSQAGAGTRAQRRALAVVAAAIADARGQARVFQQWGSATGPRGGRYVARSDGGARLVGVRVVRDATVSAALSQPRPESPAPCASPAPASLPDGPACSSPAPAAAMRLAP